MHRPRNLKRGRRLLVVDADILGQAGSKDPPRSPGQRGIRELLDAIVSICHHAALSPQLGAEWKSHAGAKARKWRARMLGRGKVRDMQIADGPDLAGRILATARGDAEAEALRKDMHLIIAALSADSIIISNDREARRHFAHAAQSVEEIGHVMWVVPEDAEEVVEWLRKDALPNEAWMLKAL